MLISAFSRPRFPLLVAVCLGLSSGCPAEDPEGGDPVDDRELVWEEGSGDNTEPWDAEGVDDGWTETVIVEGEMDRCEYNQAVEWEYTGDNDSFEIEVPGDGYIDAELSWDHSSDLDLFIYINGSGQTWRSDVQLTRQGDGPENWVPDDEFELGDDIVFTIVCARGPGGDYTLVVNFET